MDSLFLGDLEIVSGLRKFIDSDIERSFSDETEEERFEWFGDINDKERIELELKILKISKKFGR